MAEKWTWYNLKHCFLLPRITVILGDRRRYFGRKESIGSCNSSQIIENHIVTKPKFVSKRNRRKKRDSVSIDSFSSSWAQDFLPPFQNPLRGSIHTLFRNVLFSFHVFGDFPVFFILLSSSLIPCGQRKRSI